MNPRNGKKCETYILCSVSAMKRSSTRSVALGRGWSANAEVAEMVLSEIQKGWQLAELLLLLFSESIDASRRLLSVKVAVWVLYDCSWWPFVSGGGEERDVSWRVEGNSTCLSRVIVKCLQCAQCSKEYGSSQYWHLKYACSGSGKWRGEENIERTILVQVVKIERKCIDRYQSGCV